MKKLYLAALLNYLLIGGLFAQQTVFSVILNKGDNLYGSDGNFNPVLLGISLGKDDILKISEGGYVAMVHEATGASMELNEAGNYDMAEMERELQNEPITILSKYGKFLMKRLNPDNEGNQNLNVTGAVERGEIGILKVNLPKVTDIYGANAFVSWQQADDVEDYIITIKDKLDDVIAEQYVKGTNFILELGTGQLANEKMVILNVRAKDNAELRSRDFGVKKLSDRERKALDPELMKMERVANAENALNKLLIASFFEENQLLADAITYYNQAMALTPDPDGFNKLYENFLHRNGIKK